MRRFLFYWLPALLWAALILSGSGAFFSAMNTSNWLTQMAEWLGSPLSSPSGGFLNHIVRKLAHVLEYGILSALSFRALRGGRAQWTLRWAIGAVFIAVLVASTDEVHQAFVPSRTGAWQDVVVDTAGASLMQIVIRCSQVLLFWRS